MLKKMAANFNIKQNKIKSESSLIPFNLESFASRQSRLQLTPERILVALDNSIRGDQVFGEAITLARANGAHLMLLHVLSDEEIGYPDIHNLTDHLEKWEASRRLGLELLRSRQMVAIDAGISTESAQTPGTSGRTICDMARDWKADVIIVGHRGWSGLQELVQGSVSNYLVHYAPCSVLTVLERIKPTYQSLLVGIDGSNISRHIFYEALALAKAAGASLQLVNVLSVEDQGSPSILSFKKPDFERQWQSFAQSRLEMLRSHQAIATAAGVTTEIHQTLGSSPGRVICELAYSLQTDLIVVGRRGLTGLNELLMGSVSHYIIHHASCSVLTIQGQVKPNPTAISDHPMADPVNP
jgi:nucleotide-binding universal stress UspA family protein